MNARDLEQWLDADYERGVLIWKKSNGRRSIAGAIAGGLHKRTGYYRLSVCGSELWVHRVIWEMRNGPIPEGMFIDHINGVRSDNRIANLRLADRTINGINRSKAASHSGTGAVGVAFKKGAYEVSITVRGVSRYVGRFSELAAAIEAREAAKLTVLEELQARAA